MTLWNTLRQGPLQVLVVGGGNWGSAVARIAGKNAASSYIIADKVFMWLKEEEFEGRSLTDIINETHQNPRYLPGFSFPTNVVAVSDLKSCCSSADLIVIVVPHQFVQSVCSEMKGQVKRSAQALSLVKGVDVANHRPRLFSQVISDTLGIPCCALSGANVAAGIAREQFSETTLGYQIQQRDVATVWQQLFNTDYFRVQGVPDSAGVQVCGALKNVIALAAGFSDGLKWGTNTKAALIRIGVEEMRRFAGCFFDGVLEETFMESAGYADVITTCFGGRNVRCASEFVRRQGRDSWEKIEADLLQGQKMQGQLTCAEIYDILSHNNLCDHFPLFTVIYQIAFEGVDATEMFDRLNASQRDSNMLKTYMDCKMIPAGDIPTLAPRNDGD